MKIEYAVEATSEKRLPENIQTFELSSIYPYDFTYVVTTELCILHNSKSSEQPSAQSEGKSEAKQEQPKHEAIQVEKFQFSFATQDEAQVQENEDLITKLLNQYNTLNIRPKFVKMLI